MVLGAILAIAGCNNDDGSGTGLGGAGGHVATGGHGASGGLGGGTTTTSSTGGSGQVPHEECVNLINERRATLPVPAYERWTAAESCSDDQVAEEMASGTPNSLFGQCGEANTTTCMMSADSMVAALPDCLDMMWSEGPGGTDYDLLTGVAYTMVACGFHSEAGEVWVKLNFL